MKAKELAIAALFVIACELAGAIGSLFTIPAIGTWYAALHKPFFTPPSYVFGPIWLVLYALIGISAYLVWEVGLRKRGVKVALVAFAVQLVLNVLWSALFFGLRSPLYGFIAIVVLWLSVLVTLLTFWRVSKKGAAVFLPYMAWVTFALLLNLFVVLLN